MSQFSQSQLMSLLENARTFSNEQIEEKISQIERNGYLEKGSFRYALREGYQHILEQRRAAGVVMSGDIMHHPV